VRFINIVDSVSDLNFGVWNAAIINAGLLKLQGIRSELWHPGTYNSHSKNENVTFIQVVDGSENTLRNLIEERSLAPGEDVIITSGVWQYPTRWGALLKKMGYHWIFVPQGMLEPWPLRHKWLKKMVYFNLVEKRLIEKADLIRAVSVPEWENLKKKFPGKKIVFVPNGVFIDNQEKIKPQSQKKIGYLFLSRLHSKKNVSGLVTAWTASSLNNNEYFELVIAGPDQGELQKIQPLIAMSKNIRYVGTVSGHAKADLFISCRYFILPSFSEGLPSSLLEAMSYGLIPIITDGCNLPDVFEYNLGLRTTTKTADIVSSLEDSSQMDEELIQIRSKGCRKLISEKYSLEAITNIQVQLFQTY